MSPAVTFVARAALATFVSMTSTALCSTLTVAVAKSYAASAPAEVWPVELLGMPAAVQVTVAWFVPVVGAV